MLKNVVRGLTLCLLISPLLSRAETESGELIIAQEVPGQSYRFDGTQMKPAEQVQFEITYRIHDGKITRAKVYDLIKKEAIDDESTAIIYTIEPEQKKQDGKKFIRAIGRTSNGGIEMLEIAETTVQTVHSTGDEVVVSRMKRTDTVELPDVPGGEMKDEPVPLAEDSPVPDVPPAAVPRTPAEQKAYDDGHSSGLELSKTGKFANPFPENGPANERRAWFQGFKVGLNEEAKKQGEKPAANRAEAGE